MIRDFFRKCVFVYSRYILKIPSFDIILLGSSKGSSATGAVPVPVPVYCRPLAETQPGMKIWCGAGVNLMGGHTRDGGLMVSKKN